MNLTAVPCFAQDRGGWDAPPREFRDAQRQGFRDGLSAAQHDYDGHRRPDVNTHDELRRPHVAPTQADDYRDGFRRGYDAAVRHLFPNGVPAVMPWERPAERAAERQYDRQAERNVPAAVQALRWDEAPHDFREAQRQGFRDGLNAAQADYDMHHRPDVSLRGELRRPPVAPSQADEYREGFRRGYDVGLRHIFPNGVPSIMPWERPAERYVPPVQYAGRWDDFPHEYDDVHRQGFRAGLDAAQRDFEDRRRPDAERHETFRHPAVSDRFIADFRDGYRRGYDVGTRHLYPNGLPTLFPGEAPPDPWQGMDHNVVETQKQGYVAGVLAAAQDYEAGWAADPNRHEEYKSPKMNFMLKLIYKTGYKMGYDLATRNFSNRIPGTGSQLERRAFVDGVIGAQRDHDDKRRPDPDLHQEFNNPPVNGAEQQIYRNSYRIGYEMARSYLY